MNVIRCENGHYYDSDKYAVCPHCGAKAEVTGEKQKTEKPEKKPGLFSKKPLPEIVISPVPDGTIGKTFGLFGDEKIGQGSGAAGNGVPVQQQETPPVINDVGGFGGKIPYGVVDDSFWGKTPNGDPYGQSDPADINVINEDHRSEKEPPADVPPVSNGNEDQKDDLAKEIKRVSPDNSGKTIGFFHAAGTAKAEEQERVTDPVVGWLVCIKGSRFGDAFSIFSGRNSVGRSENNRIVISGENTVSRERHAWITYEPKKRQFYVQPGEGTGLTYLNGDNIMESHHLSAKDVLEFGDGKYMFVPLCGDDFSWEDHMGD